MKRIKLMLIIYIAFFVIVPNVNASSLYTSASTVYPGQTFTVSVSINAAAWNIHTSTLGPVSGCIINDANASDTAMNVPKTATATCTAIDVGTITITLDGDYTTEDGNNVQLGGSTTVQVIQHPAPQPQPSTAPKPQTPVQPQVPKSTNNYLKSLTVDGCTISPEFNKDTLEYSCKDLMIDKINIKAEVEDSKAYISGTGEKELYNGDNNFEVAVTSESGQTRIYKLLINKKNIPSTKILSIGLGNKEYKIDGEIILFGLPTGTTRIDLRIKTDSTTAKVNMTGNESLKPGYNIVNVSVTDTNCVEKVYKVLIYVQERELIENKDVVSLDKDHTINLHKNAAYVLNKSILSSIGTNKLYYHIIDENYGLLASMEITNKQHVENDYELYYIVKNNKIYTNIFENTNLKAYIGNQFKIGEKIYIYAYNEETQKYEYLTEQKYEDYYVTIKTTGSFEYLVTNKKIEENQVEKEITTFELIVVVVSQVVIMITIIVLYVTRFKNIYKAENSKNAVEEKEEEKPAVREETIEHVIKDAQLKAEKDKNESKNKK